MKSLCIIIPCYNEEKALLQIEYRDFLREHRDIRLCFVNDGSTDRTFDVLKALVDEFPLQVNIMSFALNVGKAEAVRRGIRYCCTAHPSGYYAYLDADLSTSLEECRHMGTFLKGQVSFVFGSRIMKIGSTIVRSRFRFLVGRILATIISSILGIKVYDTQCGCKMFSRALAIKLFDEPFISKWLFDVEVFQRLLRLYGREQALQMMLEIPLDSWIDRGESKIEASYFFKLWPDLFRIYRSTVTRTSRKSPSPIKYPNEAAAKTL